MRLTFHYLTSITSRLIKDQSEKGEEESCRVERREGDAWKGAETQSEQTVKMRFTTIPPNRWCICESFFFVPEFVCVQPQIAAPCKRDHSVHRCLIVQSSAAPLPQQTIYSHSTSISRRIFLSLSAQEACAFTQYDCILFSTKKKNNLLKT